MCRLLPALLLCLILPAGAVNVLPGQCPQTLAGVEPRPRYRLVIIIDDIGYQLAAGRDAVALPGKLNYAVLPYTPHGRQLAEFAHRQGKEILLHAPMTNLANQSPGKGALTPELSKQEFLDTLDKSLAQVPHVRGVNNHMGSELTSHRQQMQWLMQQLAQRGLYFVDSRTDKDTVAAQVASEQQLPNLSRQVFLDNIRTRDAIAERFARLQRLARQRGTAVAIGHPYPETLSYLAQVLPTLRQQGYRLALVSEVLGLTATAASNHDPGPVITAPAQSSAAATAYPPILMNNGQL